MIDQKPILVVAAIAVLGLIMGAVAFNTVQNTYDVDSAQLQADFDNYVFDHSKTHGDLEQAVQTIDEDHHDVLDAISENFTGVAKAHHNLMAMVITEETTDLPAASLNHFNLVTDQEWKRGELIAITGMLPTVGGLEAVITHIIDKTYKRTFNVAVFDDKSFTMPFQISTNAPLGQYTVEFKSAGKFDSISFEIIE